MPSLRSLTLSAEVCAESGGSSWSQRLQDRVGLSSWKSRRDAGEPTSRPLPFFSPSPPPLSCSTSILFLHSPSFAIRRSSPTNAYVCALLILFVLFTGTEKPTEPSRLRSCRITRSPFFSSHSVLVFLSASHSFLLLVSSSSCSHDSLYEIVSSACNYCRYVLPTPSLWTFAFSRVLHFILLYFLVLKEL